MSILADFVDKIISLKDPTVIDYAGGKWSNQRFERIVPHVSRPDTYGVSGLDSIVKLIRKEIDDVGGFLFVRVEDPKTVSVSTTFTPEEMSRYTVYVAHADVPGFRQGFREREKAIIELRSLFVPGAEVQYLLDLLSRMSMEKGATTTDNGVTQEVEVKTGVALKKKTEIRPRVALTPFRTFLEVEQPESEYLLRVNEDGEIGLFEADGGVWKLEAKRNVKAYMESALIDLVEGGKVVVMM